MRMNNYNAWAVLVPCMSLYQVKLNYYSLTYETIKGRRRLGVLPSDVDKLMPEAIFRVNIPFIRPDGSVTRMENVPNIDWSNLFSHTLAVTQVQVGLQTSHPDLRLLYYI